MNWNLLINPEIPQKRAIYLGTLVDLFVGCFFFNPTFTVWCKTIGKTRVKSVKVKLFKVIESLGWEVCYTITKNRCKSFKVLQTNVSPA